MVDYFYVEVKGRIKGQVKVMIVIKFIKNVIQYFFVFSEYFREINFLYKVIVVFFGKKKVDGEEFDEVKLNGFLSNDILSEFKKNEYCFFIVANKFQMGFDQFLLYIMYVDKKFWDV